MKNTEENNSLVANFMGYSYFLSDSGVDSWGDDDVERWEIGIDNYLKIEELEFHSSWDWLMDVISVIKTMGIGVGDDSYHLIDNIDSNLINIDIKETYLTVIEFIKRYNENK